MSTAADPATPAPDAALPDTAAEAGEVRGEDAFDVEAVDGWLRAAAPGLSLGDGLPAVRQFSGGASNLTYLVQYPERDLILRRPPAGAQAKAAHDMAREFGIQQRLAPVFPYVAPMVACCTDHDVLGSDFYVMERVDGTIIRKRLPPGVAGDLTATRALCTSVIDRLCDLHMIDPVAAGLDDLGKGAGYVGRQVTGSFERYARAKTWNVPSYTKVMRWLEANQPDDVATRLIHNDFRLDNVIVAPDDPLKVVAILDWEMATLGDPLMDLGCTLSYWISPDDGRGMQMMKLQPTDEPGMLTRAEVLAHYSERTGFSTENFAFYEVFGYFRLAVILQQIYKRYHLGQTTNPRFKKFWIANHVLHRRCTSVIRSA